jgi:beta-glucanase (GH16 family)
MKQLLLLYVLIGFGAASCGSPSSSADGSGGATSSTVTGGAANTQPGAGGQSASAVSGSGGTPVADAGSGPGAGGTQSGGTSAGGKSAGTSAGGTHSGGANSGGAHSAGASASGAGSSGATGSAGSSAIVAPSGYKLVWNDEFDTDGPPDPGTYSFEKGFVRNEEDQWYQSDNATVQGGLLVIEARKETVQNPNYTGSGDWKTTRKTAEYTSSSLSTSGHQSFQYGHFEMRARIPTDAGMWPAWWTLGVSGEWPSNGEIDIMEFYQSKLLANVACGTDTRWQAKWDSSTKSLSSLGANWTAQFHVWTMDWDDQNIVLSVDGQQLNTSALSSMLNSDGKSPFKQKAYMIVNLAIGGNNGGDPSKTSFPKRYEIDYLRVFQKHCPRATRPVASIGAAEPAGAARVPVRQRE